MDGVKIKSAIGREVEKKLAIDEKDRDADLAQSIALAVTDPENTTGRMLDIYEKWADNYDGDLGKLDYLGPSQMAEALSAKVPPNERNTVKVLDFGAGTGLVGKELSKAGFNNIDALDASNAMLKEAGKKEVYANLIEAFLGPNRLKIKDDSYSYCVSTGSFNEGHIKCDCFRELIRITKPGGLIMFTISDKALYKIEEYMKLDPTIESLEQEKKISKEEIRDLDDYFRNSHGLLYILKVL